MLTKQCIIVIGERYPDYTLSSDISGDFKRGEIIELCKEDFELVNFIIELYDGIQTELQSMFEQARQKRRETTSNISGL